MSPTPPSIASLLRLSQALVLYALTDEEGEELDDFLKGLINVMAFNFLLLFNLVLYAYIVKPAVCRPERGEHVSFSVTSQNTFHLGQGGSSINVL